MGNDQYIEVEGEVITALPNAMFKVQLFEPINKEMVCYISGKIRKHFINILPGDLVKVAISTVDPSQGRITYRIRKS